MRSLRAFTLIELLVTISIIALLIGILLPALGAARDHGQSVKCLSNVRQIAIASSAFATDHSGYTYPTSMMYSGTPYFRALQDGGYIPETSQVHRCPKDDDEGNLDGWADNVKGDQVRVTSYAMNGYFAPNHDPYGTPGTDDRGISLEDVIDASKKIYAAEIVETNDRDHFMPMYWGTGAAVHPGPGLMMARPSQLDAAGVPNVIIRDRHEGKSNFAFADGHGALHDFNDTWDDTIADRADRDAGGKVDWYDPRYDSP